MEVRGQRSEVRIGRQLVTVGQFGGGQQVLKYLPAGCLINWPASAPCDKRTSWTEVQVRRWRSQSPRQRSTCAHFLCMYDRLVGVWETSQLDAPAPHLQGRGLQSYTSKSLRSVLFCFVVFLQTQKEASHAKGRCNKSARRGEKASKQASAGVLCGVVM